MKSKKSVREKAAAASPSTYIFFFCSKSLFSILFLLTMFTSAIKSKMAITNILHSRDDDAHDHIDSDTPRSGIATPQPDPSDKRLPGIVSYFAQVGTGSSSPGSVPLETPALDAEPEHPVLVHRPREDKYSYWSTKGPVSGSEGEISQSTENPPTPSLGEEQEQTSYITSPEKSHALHSYPTPPLSNSPSMQKLRLNRSNSEVNQATTKRGKRPGAPSHRKSHSDSLPLSVRRASLMNPLSSIVTHSHVHAAHFSQPSEITSKRPAYSRLSSEFHDSPSYERLKKLTDDASSKKSIPPTPTRALSTTTAKSDNSGGDSSGHHSNGNSSKLRSEAVPTPPTLDTTGAASGLKGRLTVKIIEARGLRRCRDPYVVAVFQRNELVSKGPLPESYDDLDDIPSSGPMGIPMGGVPISRSGSDSGRPMAIPMKSRQSSNTSFSGGDRDYNKLSGRAAITNAKWDTEAV